MNEKEVSVFWLHNSKTVKEYNQFVLLEKHNNRKLDEYEFDTLKEVFGWW